MSFVDEFFERATTHSRLAIVVVLALVLVVGSGASMVEQSSSLDQFQSDTVESEKLDYIQSNFSTGGENVTTVQLIVRGDDVLSRESLLSMLEFEERLRANETVAGTLAEDNAIVGLPNVVATTAIRQEQAAELQARGQSLQERSAALEAEGDALEARSTELNETVAALQTAMGTLQADPGASVAAEFENVRANTTVELDAEDETTFERAASDLRAARNQSQVEAAYRLGTQGVLQDEFQDLRTRGDALQERGEDLQADADQLEADQEALLNAPTPTLQEQVDQLSSMNDSEVEAVVGSLLSNDGGNGGFAFAFVPTDFEPGTTETDATMILITQASGDSSAFSGSISQETNDAQLAMLELANQETGGLEYLVFGSGIILEEIDRSMIDSLVIVGPLAFLFVLVALVVAYRDLLDIVLGLVGIVAVLVLTFGFMGWAAISFNQIFVAVPVLLIGLSIDYAIHIFMRHREARTRSGDEPRVSMRVALAGVGFALTLVTATTVIGFLSNLTSPVAPIREFGVVSSVGIVAALVVFGVLVPALKIEIDEVLEARGIDRRKRAFGTGGGRFSRVLAVGSTAARRAPALVIVGALVVSAGGAYGATQVDTSFDQADFLAQDPPNWMKDLPEPFAPGEYTGKANLDFVNENFVREDSKAQILIEGSISDARTLERVDEARRAAEGKDVTQTISTGEAQIEGPIAAMRALAAEDESFATVFEAADTDGDGVPDTDLVGVYDAFFEAAPDTAGTYVARSETGDYEALRLVVGIDGGASGADVTEQMRDVASLVDGDGLTATATGQAILNKVVQDQLLETVVESLIITLVAVFVFLMITYRIIEGSATLGVVTLLPVVLSVSWILGTMYLLDIPFNVLTGMITSLTVGLGVAYSIHLSERYNQELERSESVWAAMDTAVTGTGGALLGSAATTVGGFGVLAFAILPPLQQFGVITGLTIVYAFLASVVVLPSLLVVWTRYFGPDGTAVDFGPGSAGAPAAAVGGAGPAVTVASEGNGQTATRPGVTNGVGTEPGPSVVRSVEYDHVRPGQSVGITLTVSGVDGRVVVRESFDGQAVDLASVSPDPVHVVERDQSLYVALELDAGSVGEIRYGALVPDVATDSDAFGFEGTMMTPTVDQQVGGDGSVTVVSDLFERVLAEGRVTRADLGEASRQFQAGQLSQAQVERVYRKWLVGVEEEAKATTLPADFLEPQQK